MDLRFFVALGSLEGTASGGKLPLVPLVLGGE